MLVITADGYIFDSVTACKGTQDISNAFTDIDAFYLCSFKCAQTDIFEFVAQIKSFKIHAVRKCAVCNFRYGIGNSYFFKTCAACKRIRSYVFNSFGNSDIFDSRAEEAHICNNRYSVGHGVIRFRAEISEKHILTDNDLTVG